MNIFRRPYRNEVGEELPDMRDKSFDTVELAFKIIGSIFTVCFPMAVGLLWNMSRDMHTISEKIVGISSTQTHQNAAVVSLTDANRQMINEIQLLRERIAILETQQCAGEASSSKSSNDGRR